MIGAGYALFSEDLSVAGTATAVVSQPSNGNTTWTQTHWGGPTTWTHSFNPFTVTNTSSFTYQSWTVSFDVPADIGSINCWNVTCTVQGTRMTVENLGYNGTLAPNASTSFGMQFTTTDVNYQPTNIIVVGDDGQGQDSDYQPRAGLTVVATPGSGWQSGGYYVRQYNVNVTNNTGSRVKGWRVEVSWDATKNQVVSAWNVTYVTMPNLLRFSSQSALENGNTANFGAQLGLENAGSNPSFIVKGRL